MRYILNDSGYIETISFNYMVECNNKLCTEYTGTTPTGYETLAEWSENANINAYKIVNGNLTYDSVEDTRLQNLWASQKTEVNIPIRKLLFSNESNTSLTININDSVYNYSYLYVEGDTATYNVMIPIFSASQTAFRGIGGFSGDANVGSTHAQGTISNDGKTLAFTYFKSIVHTNSSNHSASSNRNITKVIGVR